MLRLSGACRGVRSIRPPVAVRRYSKSCIQSAMATPLLSRPAPRAHRSSILLRSLSRLAITKTTTNTASGMIIHAEACIAPSPTLEAPRSSHLNRCALRLLSTAVAADLQAPTASDKIIATWLLILCAMVFVMVVLGGVTRLTESGLSITEWKPIVGALPPLSDADWEIEFAKYKKSPEYLKLHYDMTLDHFKFTYCMNLFIIEIEQMTVLGMEWGHRFWGRIIGLVYGLPFMYFLAKGHLKSPSLRRNLAIIFALGGFQGALGWYMVKSGLEVDPNSHDVPRVSQYRLAAHLSAAFALYSAMLWTAMNLISPTPAGFASAATKSVRRWAIGATAMTGITALSGAFVAGLDAGLIYNTWPRMGENWIPEDILQLQPLVRNFTENSTTVQFEHRYLAYSTVAAVTGTWLTARRAKKELSPRARTAVNTLLAVAAAQATLGISTLLTFVPTPLAAMHQAGSLTLLSTALWAAHELRRPKIPKLPHLKPPPSS